MDLSAFPFDLVLEIIVRSPSKSVAKFRCVSMQWCRVLSDPMFLEENYIAGGVIRKPIFINSTYQFQNLGVCSMDISKRIDDIGIERCIRTDMVGEGLIYDMQVYGVCRGLLLVKQLFQGNISGYLWNPTTGNSLGLNQRAPIDSSPIVEEYTRKFYGLGYVPNVREYFYMEVYDNIYDGTGIIERYSFRNGEWSTIHTNILCRYIDPDFTVSNGWLGLYFGEALHWVVLSYISQSFVILAYQCSSSDAEEIVLPSDCDFESVQVCSLVILHEFMSFCAIFDNVERSSYYVVKIWRMKENGGQRYWTQYVTLHTFHYGSGYMLPVSSTDFGVVYINNTNGMMLRMNNIDRILEHKNFEIIEVPHYMYIYEETLMWL